MNKKINQSNLFYLSESVSLVQSKTHKVDELTA